MKVPDRSANDSRFSLVSSMVILPETYPLGLPDLKKDTTDKKKTLREKRENSFKFEFRVVKVGIHESGIHMRSFCGAVALIAPLWWRVMDENSFLET